MVQAYAQPIDYPVIANTRPARASLFAYLLLAILAGLAVAQLMPPAKTAASASPLVFSCERAMSHVAALAGEPRPMGSRHHDEARDSIVGELRALGLSPQVQKTTAINQRWGQPLAAATVENIIAVLPGSRSAKSVLIAAHYDSMPTSPGASDDAAGTAAMLEAARALSQGPTLNNDVIFLFTDGEEQGLLGAQAFVREYPLAKDVGVALNFEARGVGGPAIMFETSPGNGWLIEQFARATDHRVANSLSYEIYKRLPNDTDLSIFKDAGFASLNFAFIDGLTHYHSQLDGIEQLDPRSLQHEGEMMLSLARHFANGDIPSTPQSDSVYFNFLGPLFVRYSTAWVLPLALLTAAAVFAVLGFGLKRRRLSLKPTALAAAGFLLGVGVATVAVSLTARLVLAWLDSHTLSFNGGAFHSRFYMFGFIALGVAVMAALLGWLWKKTGGENLWAGILLVFAVGGLVVGLSLPGGSYLLVWPTLFALPATMVWFILGTRPPAKNWLTLSFALAAAPAIVLYAAMLYLLMLALPLGQAGLLALLAALLLGLLAPFVGLTSGRRARRLPWVAALAGVGLIAAALAASLLSGDLPRRDSIFYALSGDAGKAMWGSLDREPDEWTAQFFSGAAQRGDLNDYTLSSYQGFLKAEAMALPLAAPEVVVIENRLTDQGRRLRLRIVSPRQAQVLSASVKSAAVITAASLNDRPVNQPSQARFAFVYYAPAAEGIELVLDLAGGEPLTLKVMDLTYGLPQAPGLSYSPRPRRLIPSPSPFTDSTMVSKTFSL